jgi:flavodoxin
MTVNRRAFLTSTVVLGATGLLTGCATTQETPVPTLSNLPQTQAATPTGAPRRVLMAYFSRPGENYYHGDRTTLEVGNTHVVADMIADATSIDVYRIEAADPYPEDYEETVARNVREENDDTRPAIANPLPDASSYDTVLLGSPVWNVQTPMIMRTFVEGIELSGKTIHPFVTYAVSGMGRVASDYERLCPGAILGEGLAVRGEEATQARPDVEAWLRRINL